MNGDDLTAADESEFYPQPKLGLVRFGIENELCCDPDDGNPDDGENYNDYTPNKEALKVVDSFRKLCFWTEDCSLRESDMEVVTKPLPHTEESMTRISNLFRKLTPHANSPKRTDVSYGLHITVSGYDLTTCEAAQKFVHREQRNSEKIAGRKENEYCNYNNYTDSKSSAINIRYSTGDRAVTGSMAEFRIFKATTQPARLRQRIQYALGVMHFLDKNRGEDESWNNFVKFIGGYRRYADLSRFISEIPDPNTPAVKKEKPDGKSRPATYR